MSDETPKWLLDLEARRKQKAQTPKWLNELEKKCEEGVKPKLSHEDMAGARCSNCLDECRGGLDFDFWRKICKNCKCTKDSHDPTDMYKRGNKKE